MCARITLKYKKEPCGIKEENEQLLGEVCKQARVESHRADISQAVYPVHQLPECLYIKEEAVDKEMPHFNELKEQKYRYIIKVEEKPEHPCVKDEEEVPHDFKQEHDEDVDTSEGICSEQQEPKRNHINEEEEDGERKQQKSPFIKKEEDIYKLPSTAFLLEHKDGSRSEASKSAEPSSRRTCPRMITDYDESHCEGSQAVSLLAPSSDIDGTSSYGNHDEESGGDLTGHSENKPWKCSQCWKMFTRKSSLKLHQRTHTGEKPFSCSVCGQRFSQKGTLKIHTRTHTGEKPFSCSLCGQIFTRNESLQTHIRVHTGEKPFSCSVCRQRFSEKGSLKRHARTHTGEKPYSCSDCGQKFSWKSQIKNHKCVSEMSSC
nr:zinc finger protein 484 isoform X2 [Syngnathus scovelli]